MAHTNLWRSALVLAMVVPVMALSGCGALRDRSNAQEAGADGQKSRDKWPSEWTKSSSNDWKSCNSGKVGDAEAKVMYLRGRGEAMRSFAGKTEDINATMDFAQQMLAQDCLERAETHFQYVVDTFPEVEFAIMREKARASLVDIRMKREDRQTVRDMNGGYLMRRVPLVQPR